MKIETIETRQVDKYVETTELFEFPPDLREPVRESIFRAGQAMTVEVYHEVPDKKIEADMAKLWAREYVKKSEGFTVEPTEHSHYYNSVNLEVCKLVMNPELFRDLIRETFQHGYDHANRFQRSNRTEIESTLDAIKTEVESLHGLYPSEFRSKVIEIIEKYR